MAAEVQVPESPGVGRGRVFALLSALFVSVLSLVVYYAAFAFAAVFSIAGSLGAPASADPPGFQVLMTAVVYGGPVWAAAAAIATYRSVRPAASPGPWRWVGDTLIVVGFGLVSAVFGLWPSILTAQQEMSSTALAGVVIGFVIGAALAAVSMTVLRGRRNQATPDVEAAAT